jgi:hypothetical protein
MIIFTGNIVSMKIALAMRNRAINVPPFCNELTKARLMIDVTPKLVVLHEATR